MIRLALALLIVSIPAAWAADAGYCIAQCNARCYGNSTPSCSASCTQRCMFSGGGGGQSSAPTQYWGAIAIGHPPDGSIGWSTHWASEAAARARAMSECRKIDTGNCDNGLTFAAPFCGAAATAWNGDDSLGSFVRTGPNRRTVEQQAMADCTSNAPNARCELITGSHCASD